MKTLLTLTLILTLTLCGCNSTVANKSNTEQSAKNIKSSKVETKNQQKRKIICPKCGKDGVPIVYGKPGRKTMKKAEEKKVYLGGCVKTPKSPKYHCYHCGNSWR